MNKFLDGNGLKYLWGKIRAAVELKQDRLTGQPGQVVGFDTGGSAVAQAAPDAGVTSFMGRSGAVTPQSGDYSAAQVGAVPVGRTVNGKALGADISLTASDVGAATMEQINDAITSAVTGAINASY